MRRAAREVGGRYNRRDRIVQEHRHDTYRARAKLPEPTTCPDCGAVYRKGRWTWGTASEEARQSPCPACQRIRDRFPAGVVSVEGPFFDAHREEVLNLIRNVEGKAKAEHPLHRIMAVEEVEEGVEISTTDTHLPRRLGEALVRAHGGDLSYKYPEEEQLIRVTWRR